MARDTSNLPDDNQFKQFAEYVPMLEYLAQKFATWSNVAGTASSADLGSDLWFGGAYRLMQLSGKLASDLGAWLQLPDQP